MLVVYMLGILLPVGQKVAFWEGDGLWFVEKLVGWAMFLDMPLLQTNQRTLSPPRMSLFVPQGAKFELNPWHIYYLSECWAEPTWKCKCPKSITMNFLHCLFDLGWCVCSGSSGLHAFRHFVVNLEIVANFTIVAKLNINIQYMCFAPNCKNLLNEYNHRVKTFNSFFKTMI